MACAISLEHTAERATVQFSLMASYLHEYFHLAKVINLIFAAYAKLFVNSSKLPNHQTNGKNTGTSLNSQFLFVSLFP